MRADYHVHTAFSDDSDYPMEQVVRDAIALGLEELCFTDHVDYGIKTDWEEPEAMRYRKGGPGEPDKIPLANSGGLYRGNQAGIKGAWFWGILYVRKDGAEVSSTIKKHPGESSKRSHLPGCLYSLSTSSRQPECGHPA